MNEYTPTTKEVRESFYIHAYSRDMEHLRAEGFDRWLTARDAEIRTVALEEAAGIATAESDDLRYGFTCRSIAHSIRAAKDGD